MNADDHELSLIVMEGHVPNQSHLLRSLGSVSPETLLCKNEF